jgi:hypothetical protein
MSEHEARRRAVYDHDNEEPRPAGRRRRQVADWGVGEEIFDHMPGRRFERRSHSEIPRGDAADGRRTIVIDTGEDELLGAAAEPVGDEFASRDEALRAREARDELWAGEEPFADDSAAVDERPAIDEWAAGDEPFADERAGARAADDDRHPESGEVTGPAWDQDEITTAAEERARTDAIVRGGQAGRRTVKIGGRPAEFHGTPPRARQRPPRAMHERLGPRPDRVAMWAFALGLLLILIAVATAKAAVPV